MLPTVHPRVYPAYTLLMTDAADPGYATGWRGNEALGSNPGIIMGNEAHTALLSPKVWKKRGSSAQSYSLPPGRKDATIG